MSIDFDGKVIAVSGAGRGLGREHVLLLASHGARVVVNDLGGSSSGSGSDASPADEVVDEIVAAGGTAVANHDDVADWDGGARLVQLAIDSYGRLDGLVNNAGILRDATLVGLAETDWDASVRVNLKGHVAPSHAAARYWRERFKAGETVRAAIVNTSSESGVFGNAGQSNYNASKAGIASLTETWARELARYGVRSNAVLPRARTRLTEGSFGSEGVTVKEGSFDKWHPGNISPWVAYLLSDQNEITGQVFVVGGGLVQRVRGWSLDAEWKLRSEERWTMEGLMGAVEAAGVPTNADRDTGFIR
jgi:NAD(P)-dependent dehydrogenase (short-subunit alcohol dehydrogenase family)